MTEPQHRGGLSPAFRLDGEAIWVMSKYPYAEWTLRSSEVARVNSLAAQQLGLGAFTAVGPGSIPGQRTKILWAGAAKKKEEEVARNQKASRASLAASTPTTSQPCRAGCFHPSPAGLACQAFSDPGTQALGRSTTSHCEW